MGEIDLLKRRELLEPALLRPLGTHHVDVFERQRQNAFAIRLAFWRQRDVDREKLGVREVEAGPRGKLVHPTFPIEHVAKGARPFVAQQHAQVRLGFRKGVRRPGRQRPADGNGSRLHQRDAGHDAAQALLRPRQRVVLELLALAIPNGAKLLPDGPLELIDAVAAEDAQLHGPGLVVLLVPSDQLPASPHRVLRAQCAQVADIEAAERVLLRGGRLEDLHEPPRVLRRVIRALGIDRLHLALYATRVECGLDEELRKTVQRTLEILCIDLEVVSREFVHGERVRTAAMVA
mmetsp:Transcript_73153/g.223764  ORF Transcript_73153/g.223764 Transcript_73153/m.223764 type:complete len:291 (+) Transcript_73153:1998-2870(+)